MSCLGLRIQLSPILSTFNSYESLYTAFQLERDILQIKVDSNIFYCVSGRR